MSNVRSREYEQMVDELKAQFGESARDVIINGLNLQSVGNNHYRCPNGHAHKHNDKKPSMGWVKNRNFFMCQGCGTTIDIFNYYRDYLNYSLADIMQDNGIEIINSNRKLFIQSSSVRKKLTNEQIKYITGRGITAETIEKFKLINMQGAIGIPYFKNGILTGIKKRMLTGVVKNLSADGSKFFFFNFDDTEYKKPLVVTEGEWDCMVLSQCGIENVVSVGCGASSTASLFENAEHIMKEFPSIVLFTDNDERGDLMDKAFKTHYKSKIVILDKTLYGLNKEGKPCKDANEVYLNHGEQKIKDIIESGMQYFGGEVDLEKHPYKGLDEGNTKFIKTGMDSIDYAINCVQSKTVTLITGRSNAGKSTFVNQIIASAINQNNKVLLALGEGNKDKILNRFYTSIIGANSKYYDLKMFGIREVKEPKPFALKAIQQWHKNKLRLWVKAMSEKMRTEDMLDMIEYKATLEKFDLIVLDNQMSLLTVDRASDKLEAQANFVQRCHDIADATNTAVILILHPNKTYKKGEEMDFEQISGTSDIPNKADVILNVIRVAKDDVVAGVTSKIQVAKNRDWPDLPMVDCAFCAQTFTFAEVVEGAAIRPLEISWEKYIQKDNAIAKEFIVEDEKEVPWED